MKVPRKIIYQMNLQIEAKKRRIAELQAEVKELERNVAQMQPMEKKS